MKKPMLKDSLKFLYEHGKTLIYKENHIKAFSRVHERGAFLYLLFCLSFFVMSGIGAKKTE